MSAASNDLGRLHRARRDRPEPHAVGLRARGAWQQGELPLLEEDLKSQPEASHSFTSESVLAAFRGGAPRGWRGYLIGADAGVRDVHGAWVDTTGSLVQELIAGRYDKTRGGRPHASGGR